MALLVVTGLPSSGRSTRVAEIQRHFDDRIRDSAQFKRVVVLTDDDVYAGRAVYDCRWRAALRGAC